MKRLAMKSVASLQTPCSKTLIPDGSVPGAVQQKTSSLKYLDSLPLLCLFFSFPDIDARLQ